MSAAFAESSNCSLASSAGLCKTMATSAILTQFGENANECGRGNGFGTEGGGQRTAGYGSQMVCDSRNDCGDGQCVSRGHVLNDETIVEPENRDDRDKCTLIVDESTLNGSIDFKPFHDKKAKKVNRRSRPKSDNASNISNDKVPYRCIVDDCAITFNIKNQLFRHIQSVHKFKVVFVGEEESILSKSISAFKTLTASKRRKLASKSTERAQKHDLDVDEEEFNEESDSDGPSRRQARTFTETRNRQQSDESDSDSLERKRVDEYDLNPKPIISPKNDDSIEEDRPQFVCDYAGCEKAYFKKAHLSRHLSSHKNSDSREPQQSSKRPKEENISETSSEFI
ncbi:hypothetical protein B4U79_17350 [Dinothrombium tinctorium]|uniref:C2H2-type domain-containing protein n=1 Tax=Dinothrombium tinctorium TaxID=1965070 RepID=A0A443RE67_9ACAR|nr:hypothetical protein B4U79_17350 [Dinothrombium tinctorium]